MNERSALQLSTMSVVAQSRGLLEAAIDEDTVLLSIERGTCYSLNHIGSRIWGMLASPARIGDVCTTLLAEYRIDRDMCERQVLDLLEELQSEGLIAKTQE
jgi:hypothetical protein